MTIFLAIIFISIILLLHELGHFWLAKFFKVKVEEFGFGFPPRIWAKKIGETEYSFNWLPLGGFNKINEESFERQPASRRMLILAGGILTNVFLGWLFFSLVFMIGSKPLVIVSDLAPNSPAALAGIQKNDAIISVDYPKETLVAPFSGQTFIEFVNRYRGETLTLKISRAGKTISFQTTSRKNPPAGEGPLGVAIVDAGVPAKPFGQSLVEAFKTTGQVIGLSFSSIYRLVTRAFAEPAMLDALTGPVGVVALAGQIGKISFTYFLQIMAFISLGFAVFNVLPFPALDGGHLLFILIEKIKGSPIPVKIKGLINGLSFGLLLILMVFVTIKDIKGLL
ncbi:MAG: M50 family metallopeptidase [Patescibacteria group bacterium]